MAAPSSLTVGERDYSIYRIAGIDGVRRLPYTLRVLLENVLRNGGDEEVDAVANWDANAEPAQEISFVPSRVLLQDFTGVPAVVDLAAMRNAIADLGGDAGADQPADPRRARDRPLGAGRRVRVALGLRAQRRARVRAQPRAVRVPALGAARVPRLQGRPAGDRASATR